jgi:hypothetical protein
MSAAPSPRAVATRLKFLSLSRCDCVASHYFRVKTKTQVHKPTANLGHPRKKNQKRARPATG